MQQQPGVPMQPMFNQYSGVQQPGVPMQPMFNQYSGVQQQGAVGVPPGLEYLASVDALVVKQKKEMFEMFTGWESGNRYEILNAAGQRVYFAAEDTNFGSMMCFGSDRPFSIKILNVQSGQPVAAVQADVDCFTQNVTVQVPFGQVLATITKEFALFTPTFYVNNAQTGQPIFKIHSSATAAFGTFGDVEFDILSADGQTVVGKVTKKWSGFFREAFTDADTFGLRFPLDMDVRWKAVLLGALFHIDYTFYEKSNN